MTSDPHPSSTSVTDDDFQQRIFPDDLLETISSFGGLSEKDLRSLQERIQYLSPSIFYEDVKSKQTLLHFLVRVQNPTLLHLQCVRSILEHFHRSVVQQMIGQRDIYQNTPLSYAIESKFITLPEDKGKFTVDLRNYQYHILLGLMANDEALCLDHYERNVARVTLKTIPNMSLVRIVLDRIKQVPDWLERIKWEYVFFEFLNLCKIYKLEESYQMIVWRCLPFAEFLLTCFANGLTLVQYACCSNACQSLKEMLCMQTLKAIDVCLGSKIEDPVKRNQYIRLKTMLSLLINRLNFNDFWESRASLWPALNTKRLTSSKLDQLLKAYKDNDNSSSATMKVIFDNFSVLILGASPPNSLDYPVQSISFNGDVNKALMENCATIAILSATVDVYFVGHENRLFGPDEMDIFPVPLQLIKSQEDAYTVVDKSDRESYLQLGTVCILKDHCQPVCTLVDVVMPKSSSPRNESYLSSKSFPVTWFPTVKIIELLKSKGPFDRDIQQQIYTLLRELEPSYLYNSPFQFGKHSFIHDVLFCLHTSAPIDYILSILKFFQPSKFWLTQDKEKDTLLHTFLKTMNPRSMTSENIIECLKLLCQDDAALLLDNGQRNALCTAIEFGWNLNVIQGIIDSTISRVELLHPKTSNSRNPLQSLLQCSLNAIVDFEKLYPMLLSGNTHMLLVEVDEISKMLPIQHLLLKVNSSLSSTINKSFIEQVWADTKRELLSSKQSNNIPKLEAIVQLSEFKLNAYTYFKTMRIIYDLEMRSMVSNIPLTNTLMHLQEKLEGFKELEFLENPTKASFTTCNFIFIPASKLVVVLNVDQFMESKRIPVIQFHDERFVDCGYKTVLEALEVLLIMSTTWTIILGSYYDLEKRISRVDIRKQQVHTELFEFDFGNLQLSREVMVFACSLYTQTRANASYDILFYSANLKKFFSCLSSQFSSFAGNSSSKDTLKGSDSGSSDKTTPSKDVQQNSQILVRREMWDIRESPELYCFIRAVNEYLQNFREYPDEEYDYVLQIICDIVAQSEKEQGVVGQRGIVCGLTASRCVQALNNLLNTEEWLEYIVPNPPPLNLVVIVNPPTPLVIIRNNDVNVGPTIVLSNEAKRQYGSARFDPQFSFFDANGAELAAADPDQYNTRQFDCPL